MTNHPNRSQNVPKQMKDITLYFDRGDNGWAFKPHSGRADAFLHGEFNAVGDRDLTQDDIYLIKCRAERAGLAIVIEAAP
jgi:hypothetical protein